jgi:hypothetical protein
MLFPRLRRAERAESAQTIILFALLLPVMMSIVGLTVEGGRVWVEYRKMQAAADMAALIGAQNLPCGITISAADANCRNSAETLACTYADNNGFPGCVGGNSLSPSPRVPAANVPPIACSPYDYLDYGTDSTTAKPTNCKGPVNGVSSFDYIEVRLQDQLGTVPIFNIPITLYSHAVARNGVPSAKDFAVSILDPGTCAFTITGTVGYFVNGTTFVNGTYCPGSQARNACDGGFFTASSGAGSSSLVTYSGGQTSFAPPMCEKQDPNTGVWSTFAADSPSNYVNDLPSIHDPYCSSYSPPFQNTTAGTTSSDCGSVQTASTKTMPNCPDCNYPGFWWDGSQWNQGGTVSDNKKNPVELFPGTYDGFSICTNCEAYFNPGVYTFNGAFDTSNGSYCVMGAPACDDAACTIAACGSTKQCGNASFGINSDAGNQWYFVCSPFGKWDTTLPRNAAGDTTNSSTCANKDASGKGPCLSAPTWLQRDSSGNDSVTTKPLNGVTIYMKAGSATGSGHGGAASTYMAFPNPCVGNGTSGPAADGWMPNNVANAVEFNKGTNSHSAVFTYPVGSYATTAPHAYTVAYGDTDGIYPSVDLSKLGECANNNYELWPGEMPVGQHVHFMWFDRVSASSLSLGGNTIGDWDGIMYDPNGLADMHGTSGATNGPPFIFGQLIARDLLENGTDTMDLVYRPCGDKETACASGPGTELVE